MNIIFTCGGTGGHINPAIAVAKLVQKSRPQSKILFVGAEDGMETDLVPREGFELETVKISNFQRKPTPKNIAHNVKTAVNIAGSLRKADKIIDSFKPDVIIGTGGYASFPILYRGAARKIPAAVHEANAVPGLATRLVADKVDRILVNFAESANAYKDPSKVIAVGMPVKEEFVFGNKAEARKKLDLDDKPLVVSYWGSLGAREMNKKIADFIRLECEHEPFNHIHATGSFGWRWMPDRLKDMGVDLAAHKSVDMREYIYDMPTVMAAADIVISRAGASTLSEITASGKASIIVPSPNVTGNHQEKNARILENRGAAKVITEDDCTGQVLFDLVAQLLSDRETMKSMSAAAAEMSVPDSASKIYSVICELSDKNR